MHLQAHAQLGWLAGAVVPGADRRLRNWCLAASVAPDLDGLSYAFGSLAFSLWHHTFGHNVFLGALLMIAAAWHYRDRPVSRRVTACLLVGLLFASHLWTDAALTSWPLKLWWPFSDRQFVYQNGYMLESPINTWLVFGGMALLIPVAIWKKVTPVNVLSPWLDAAVLNIFRPRALACGSCGGACNNRCGECGRPTCMRHGRITWKLRIRCAACGR